jgi:hypothetical protein
MPLPWPVDDPYLADNLDELDRRTYSSGITGGSYQRIGTFLNNWNHYSVVGATAVFQDLYVWRQADDTVFLSGLVGKAPFGSATFAQEYMFQIPAGFIPAKQIVMGMIAANTSNSMGMGRIDVQPDGWCYMVGGGPANPVGYVSFHHFWKGA